MNSELKSKWTTALRSGKYAQCVGELYGSETGGNGKGFCCLGVLCKVVGMPNTKLFQKDTLDSVGLPELLGPWNCNNRDVHFSSSDETTMTTTQRRLAAMNDNDCTFEEIAAWIDANVPTEASDAGVENGK